MKIENRIICQQFPNESIREFHTTKQMNAVDGMCQRIEASPGNPAEGKVWGGSPAFATPENSSNAFVLANALVTIPGIKKVNIAPHTLRITLYDAFEWERDNIEKVVVLAIRRYVYGIRAKVTVVEHKHNNHAIDQRFNLNPWRESPDPFSM